MQHPFSCTPITYAAVEKVISAQRLGRYLRTAGGDKHMALRLYVWNSRLCEAFYIPCQFAEVAVRNGAAQALAARYQPDWHLDARFPSTLPDRLARELERTIADGQREHGANATVNHVVSGVSLGFWTHLFTKNFRHILWKHGFGTAFPHIPRTETSLSIYKRIDRLRNWRNRIAHYNAIFDKGPAAEMENVQTILSWACPETFWLLNQLSNVSTVINQRPAI